MRRIRLNLSQEELAGRAGLHRTYICDIERGARNVSLKSIEKLATALEVPVAGLFSDTDAAAAEWFPRKLVGPDELVDILFVEGNREAVELTLETLRNSNIANRIHVVRDGEAALDFLFRDGEFKPEMILLDLGLPRISGLEVLKQVKSDPRTSEIPVVVLSATRSSRDIAASKQLGAQGYIIKPVDFQNLSEVTSRLRLQWALLKPAPALNT